MRCSAAAWGRTSPGPSPQANGRPGWSRYHSPQLDHCSSAGRCQRWLASVSRARAAALRGVPATTAEPPQGTVLSGTAGSGGKVDERFVDADEPQCGADRLRGGPGRAGLPWGHPGAAPGSACGSGAHRRPGSGVGGDAREDAPTRDPAAASTPTTWWPTSPDPQPAPRSTPLAAGPAASSSGASRSAGQRPVGNLKAVVLQIGALAFGALGEPSQIGRGELDV